MKKLLLALFMCLFTLTSFSQKNESKVIINQIETNFQIETDFDKTITENFLKYNQTSLKNNKLIKSSTFILAGAGMILATSLGYDKAIKSPKQSEKIAYGSFVGVGVVCIVLGFTIDF